jgi:hypothetical protein
VKQRLSVVCFTSSKIRLARILPSKCEETPPESSLPQFIYHQVWVGRSIVPTCDSSKHSGMPDRTSVCFLAWSLWLLNWYLGKEHYYSPLKAQLMISGFFTNTHKFYLAFSGERSLLSDLLACLDLMDSCVCITSLFKSLHHPNQTCNTCSGLRLPLPLLVLTQ